ncbi:amino acid ABC transporter substrate-binding protein (PAAT family) [Agrococcus jenensis]|uniref:Amino acid ABC transporter substrate-binding protein (PAAT family) n=2 Tax=Agrococcus jenensis TaxID=46353 RepID=A0A3N2AQJ9_9MICO|nr:amino acid ABC transporter substrate-binding protein (PAAT family) [Agrococcus jenensis]
MVGRMGRFLRSTGAIALAVTVLTGCATVPADPDGTLERVQGGVLRVGVTENAPWVELSDGGDPSGTEPALILEFAERLDAEVEWTPGSEATLAEALEAGELDLVIGGFVEDTPWTEFGASTRPYVEAGTAEGNDKHVMLAPLGENAFLVALETFLDEQAVS